MVNWQSDGLRQRPHQHGVHPLDYLVDFNDPMFRAKRETCGVCRKHVGHHLRATRFARFFLCVANANGRQLAFSCAGLIRQCQRASMPASVCWSVNPPPAHASDGAATVRFGARAGRVVQREVPRDWMATVQGIYDRQYCPEFRGLEFRGRHGVRPVVGRRDRKVALEQNKSYTI